MQNDDTLRRLLDAAYSALTGIALLVMTIVAWGLI